MEKSFVKKRSCSLKEWMSLSYYISFLILSYHKWPTLLWSLYTPAYLWCSLRHFVPTIYIFLHFISSVHFKGMAKISENTLIFINIICSSKNIVSVSSWYESVWSKIIKLAVETLIQKVKKYWLLLQIEENLFHWTSRGSKYIYNFFKHHIFKIIRKNYFLLITRIRFEIYQTVLYVMKECLSSKQDCRE